MPGAEQVSVRNCLLAALPRTDYRKLLQVLEPVTLPFGEILYESHAQIRHVYFPNNRLVSMLTSVDSDRAAEVRLIGSEGMIGVPMALDVAVSPFRAVVQGGGMAMRMTTADLRPIHPAPKINSSAMFHCQCFVCCRLSPSAVLSPLPCIFLPVHGELLIKRRWVCGTGRDSELARRIAADQRPGVKYGHVVRPVFSPRARCGRARDCSSERIGRAYAEDPDDSRTRRGRDTLAGWCRSAVR